MKTKILLKSLLVLIVSIFCSVNVMGQGGFTPVWSDAFQPMNIVVTNATFDDVVLEPEDQIGVFFQRVIGDPAVLTEFCVGYVEIAEDSNFPTDPLTIIISMQDGSFSVADDINGAVPGDSLYFKYNLDNGAGFDLETDIDANYSSGNHVATAWATSVVSLSKVSYVTQTIALAEGKNLVTIKVVAEDDNVSSVFAGVSNLVKVESQGGLYQYIPTTHWVNTLGTDDGDEDDEGNLTYDVGYWIETSAAGTLTINGAIADTVADIGLEKGWNIFPYYRDFEEGRLAKNELNNMNAVWENGTILQSVDGEEIVRTAGNWTGDDVDTFRFYPNKAYLIYVPNGITVKY